MLDRFVYGSVERISPEAPIPVIRVNREVCMLGGAGNAARNAAILGGEVILLAVIGDDPAAREFEALARGTLGIDAKFLRNASRQTTVKTRYVSSGQQLLRADEERIEGLSASDALALQTLLQDHIGRCDAVIVSDYGKGVLTDAMLASVFDIARNAGKPVAVDPKNADLSRYSGAYVLTPNAKELQIATGLPVSSDSEVEIAAAKAVSIANANAVLVTRAAQGMTLVEIGGTARHISAEAREVFDVSGAGDTVIATLALAIGAGASLFDAAIAANAAAGIAVGKAGTAAVRPDELAAALSRQSSVSGPDPKIRSLESLTDLTATWRAQGRRVGFTNGCFDLLHPGHISLLKQARKACDRLIVGLNSDASVQRLKGPGRPVNDLAARATVLASLDAVDAVVSFDQDTPLDLIQALKPDVLVKGADYALDQIVGASIVQSYGGAVVRIDLVPGQSTTQTIERMSQEK
jgi:D-beta-D-heptose 7-phosphate kinase/D-beta-D-heptose 1-phosphate adenosyltransferase